MRNGENKSTSSEKAEERRLRGALDLLPKMNPSPDPPHSWGEERSPTRDRTSESLWSIHAKVNSLPVPTGSSTRGSPPAAVSSLPEKQGTLLPALHRAQGGSSSCRCWAGQLGALRAASQCLPSAASQAPPRTQDPGSVGTGQGP